jgi:3-dehydroquinate synthase
MSYLSLLNFLNLSTPNTAFGLPEAGMVLQTQPEAQAYPIVFEQVGPLFDGLAPALSAVGLKAPCKVLLVSDAHVAPLYAKPLTHKLEAFGYEVFSLVVAAGEGSKSLATFEHGLETALKAGLKRNDVMLALGGGITGDLTGYAAASYYRGLAFVQVPTTLLAMVDSSVGGKVGLNLAHVKNAVGAFYQPKLVYMAPQVLQTLPQREVLAGLAEAVKYAFIERSALGLTQPNEPLPVSLLQQFEAQAADWQNALPELIATCCLLKAAVVKRDEREQAATNDPTGRVCLNLGHTFAHAFEAVCFNEADATPTLLHGEAVALGLRLAAALAVKLGYLTEASHQRVNTLLDVLNLRYVWPVADEVSVETLLGWMGKDKKNTSGGQNVRFILPCEPLGTVRVETLSGEALTLVAIVLDEMRLALA